MQDIFRQISNQRANATRTTVKGQKIIFQPPCRWDGSAAPGQEILGAPATGCSEFRRLDFKPLSIDDRRYPPPPDSMIPLPRPAPQAQIKGRLWRNEQRKRQ